MKHMKYFTSVLAALLLTGCSDDIDPNNGNDLDTPTGTGYINVAINLPTQTGMTKSQNDQFDDGVAEEYEVNKVYLAIFKGQSESSATQHSAYDITDDLGTFGKDETTANITTRAEKIIEVKIGQPTDNEKYYAFVVVNPNMFVSLDDVTGSSLKKLSIKTTLNATSSTVITNLESLRTVISNTSADPFIGSDGFLMTSSPLSNVSGNSSDGKVSGVTVQTLVPISVYKTEEAAKLGGPSDIFVERIVAKVTVSCNNVNMNGRINVTDPNNVYNGDLVAMSGWFLNVTNKSTKFLRDVTDAATWANYPNPEYCSVKNNRFFSLDRLPNTLYPYRIYWAKDNNYDGKLSTYTDPFTVYAKGSSIGECPSELYHMIGATGNGIKTAAYCLENTFDAACMTQDQTTTVVFKMEYYFNPNRGKSTFYMLDNDNTIYVKDLVIGKEESEIEKKLTAAVNEKLSGDNKIERLSVQDVTEGGYYDTLDEIKMLFKDGTAELSNEQAKKILAAVKQVKVYLNGTTYYYAARIKHFGDYYTPLPSGVISIDDVSLYETDKHLGRYGVVRNNWYEIAIIGVSGPGMPENPGSGPDPDPEGPDPDDKEYKYINVRVNVLSWAKRTQNVEL
mgnify:CR=1 FL=1